MRIRLEEILYYLFFGILFAAKGVGLDYGEKAFFFCLAFALLCLALKLLMTEHTIKEWLVMLLLVMLGGVIYLHSGEHAAIMAALIIVGMKNIPIRRLLKVCLGIWSVTFALSCFLGYFHIRDGVVVVHEKMGLGPIIRWSLGYTHPNVLHISYFVLAALILYVFEWTGKKLWKATAVLFVGNVLVFLFSISYTGVLIVAGYLGLNLYLQSRGRLCGAESFLLQCILPFCVFFPLAGPFVLRGKAFDFFNKLLTTRFELVKMYFENFKPSLFGTAAHFENTNAKLTLDSSFAYLLMYYGIIAFVLFILGYFLMIRWMIKEEKKKELAIMIAIAVAGITEQFLFNLSFKNLSFLFLGNYLFEAVLYRKENGTIWNREIYLIPGGRKEFPVPDLSGYSERIRSFFGIYKGKIRIAMALLALLSGGVCAAAVQLPDSVYVNRWMTDYRNPEEEVSLDLAQADGSFQSMVLGYDGPEVGMYRFTGNIITMEFVRSITGAAVLGAAAVWVCCVGIALSGYTGNGGRGQRGQ